MEIVLAGVKYGAMAGGVIVGFIAAVVLGLLILKIVASFLSELLP